MILRKKILWLLLTSLLLALPSGARDWVEWTRHTWGAPSPMLLTRDVFLGATVYRDFPEWAPLAARRFSWAGAQKGVWLCTGPNVGNVGAGVARRDLIEAHFTWLQTLPGIKEIQVRAAELEKQGEIERTQRSINSESAQRILTVWETLMGKCSVAINADVDLDWSLHVAQADRQVMEFDMPGKHSSPLMVHLVAIAEALIAYSDKRLTEAELMKIVDTAETQTTKIKKRTEALVRP